MDIDLEDINYKPKNQLPSQMELSFEDLVDTASQYGVDKQVLNVVSKDWDEASVADLLSDPQSSEDLVTHIASGAYDLVNERITQKRMTDTTGGYSNMPVIEQYREAAAELENEYVTYMQEVDEYNRYMAMMEHEQAMQDQAAAQQQMQQRMPPQQPEMAQYVDDEQRNRYMEQAAQKRSKVNETRRKASSLSKKKRRTSRPKQTIDPLSDLNDDQFTEYLDSLIYK
jgi:hypothetical protein